MPKTNKGSSESAGQKVQFNSRSLAGFAEQKLKVDLFRKGFLLDDRFDEPTYLTFYLDFDFGAHMIDNTTSLTASPLLNFNINDKSGMGLSAHEFLFNRKQLNLAKHLADFNSKLEYINNNTPWYFQKLGGLDKLWGSTVASQKLGSIGDIELEVGCLESVDLRLLQLGELYHKSVYDQTFMRSIIPSNLRKFHMNIYIGEVRDIYNNVGDVKNKSRSGSLIGSFADVTNRGTKVAESTSTTLNSTFRLNSIYYYKFECFNCEFDFTPIFDQSLSSFTQDKPNEGSFKIKIGRVQSSGSFGEDSFTSTLYRDKVSSPDALERNRKAVLDQIGAAQRASLSRENITLLKLANNLGPFSQVATSSLLKLDRKVNNILRSPNRFVNGARSEIQRLAERGSLRGSLSPNNNSRRRNF